jgi:hypothetical protein
VVGNRITGRFRYINGESYYDHYICRTGSGTLVKKSILKDAWVSFSAKAEPKPRQLAKQD